ncbi:MAG: NAD(P)/FAD-dependent oxidoreductase [Porticoccaceae bacterium]|jgi:phytoene dehydrogenase-like protein|nr:NAD(P)/FAD-dependent oxidoreductase [Porticoccaceae bacterium]|tara:strand:- start:994 stop:2727 length:1734 start_codon:yes stop_codon:yes gene_type:complete
MNNHSFLWTGDLIFGILKSNIKKTERRLTLADCLEWLNLMKKYDAIIIGAGHNGLTNAAYLAKAGLDVLVLEKNGYIGGATVSRELYPNWKYSNCSYVCSLLRPEIIRDLELPRHGLQVVPYGGGVTFKENGDYLGAHADHERMLRELARHSKRDASAYERYEADVMKQTRLIRPFLMRTPPDPTSLKPRDLKELSVLAKSFGSMGEEALADTMRFWTMSIGDFLDEYFETDVIKAHLAGSGIIGTALGVYSPGTAYVLLHHYMGDVDGSVGAWGFARGGMGAVSAALSASFQSFGGTIQCDAEVAQIIVKNGKAKGVALANGDELYADIVVSNLDPKRTFLKIMDEGDLPADVVKKAKNFKIRGSSGKLNIALDGLPTFTGLPKDSPLCLGEKHFSDSLPKMERAYDEWKDGTWSKDPYVDMLIPTQIDPTMAPPGKHMMSVFVQYAPPKIHGGDWTAEDKAGFEKTVIDQISNYSPDFKDLILHCETRTPQDIENEVGLTEGNIFMGELTFDQLLFNRPFPGYAQYRGPVKGMYMCSSGTHPGGGVMAAPGANAAREILMDLKLTNTVPGGYDDD